MRAVGQLPSLYPALSVGPLTFQVAAVEINAGDVFGLPIADDTTGKRVAMPGFDQQSYKREKVWLTVIQVDDVEDPLRAVSQSQEDMLMESLGTSKY